MNTPCPMCRMQRLTRVFIHRMYRSLCCIKLQIGLSLMLGLLFFPSFSLHAEIQNPLLPKAGQLSSEKQAVPSTPSTTPAEDTAKTGLNAFYSWAGTLDKDLIDLQSRLNGNNDVSAIEAKLPDINNQINTLQAEVDKLRNSASPQYLDIDNLQTRLQRLLSWLEKLNEPVAKSIADLSALREQWTANKQQLADFVASKDIDTALTAGQQLDARQSIDTALGLIEQALTPLLNLGKQIGEIRLRLYTTETNVRQSQNEFRQVSIRRTSPSMLSGEFYKQINSALLAQIRTNLEQSAERQLTYFRQHLLWSCCWF